MDQKGGGGCCIARYAGGAYDIPKVDRIMLRFRPIAPKPTTADDCLSAAAAVHENNEPVAKTGRGKRRRAAKDTSNMNRRRKASPEYTDSSGSVSEGDKVVKTLSFLPETPDVMEVRNRSVLNEGFDPLLLSFGDGGHVRPEVHHLGLEDLKVETWVKVESVSNAWVDCCGIGRTDEERVANLGADTCPGFVSDGLNRVRWMNAAYRRMVAGEHGGEVAATVVVEEAPPPLGCEAFTCRVRVITCGNEKKISCTTVPCDVWRMNCGGFAWRLDTAAALSLGR